MSALIFPRRLIVEARFEPSLRIFGLIFNAAIAGSKFISGKDWRKGDDVVELLDNEKLTSIGILYDRVVVITDRLDAEDERAKIPDILDAVLKTLDITKLRRVGARSFFALKAGEKGRDWLIKDYAEKLLEAKPFEQELGMRLKDFAVVLELVESTDLRRKGRVEYGVMKKDEWKTRVTLDQAKIGYVSPENREKILNSLPDDLVFLDIDLGLNADDRSEVTVSDIPPFLDSASSKSKQVARMLLSQYGI